MYHPLNRNYLSFFLIKPSGLLENYQLSKSILGQICHGEFSSKQYIFVEIVFLKAVSMNCLFPMCNKTDINGNLPT